MVGLKDRVLKHGPELRDYMLRTYHGLRWSLLLLSLVFPWVLNVGERLAEPHHAQPSSISGYYHTTAMRNYFVATLVAVGLGLYLYKGFGRAENWFLNIAGVAAIAVAFLPCARDQGATDGSHAFAAPTLHAVAAYILFACIGITSVFLGPLTLDQVDDPAVRRRFLWIYRSLGVAMIVLPAIAIIARAHVFAIEAIAVEVFCLYWIVKTWEYRRTEAEMQGLTGAF
jgi:hypothetical protein